MNLRVRPISLAVAIVLLLGGCASAETSVGDSLEAGADGDRDVTEPDVRGLIETEPTPEPDGLPNEPTDELVDDRAFLGALIGSWESPGCSSNGGCTIWTFEATGEFTYEHMADDYEEEYSNQWSVQVIAEDVGLVAFEDAGIHLFVMDDEGLRVPGQGSSHLQKAASGTVRGAPAPVDPGPLAIDLLGTWFRPDGAAVRPVLEPDELTLYEFGVFEAKYGHVSCAGLWAFDVAGDMGINRGGPREGSLTLHSEELCNNRGSYRDRAEWERITYLSASSIDGLMFFNNLEYRGAPSSDLHFVGTPSTRISEPIIAGEPVVLVMTLDQPFSYGDIADEIHSMTVYMAGGPGSAIHSPGEEIIGDGTKFTIDESVAIVPGESAVIELPIVFDDPVPYVHVQVDFEMLLDGEMATQGPPSARFSVEVAAGKGIEDVALCAADGFDMTSNLPCDVQAVPD